MAGEVIKVKRILFSAFCGMMFLVSATVGTIVSQAASTKTTAGFWSSSSVQGIAYTGPTYLAKTGYEYTIWKDAAPYYFYQSLRNDDIIFVSCHGLEGGFEIAPGTQIWGTTIDNQNFTAVSRLVYISACNTGLQSSTKGDVLAALMRKGVTSAVGFEDELSATTDTDGSHRFDALFAYKFVSGSKLNEALLFAKDLIYHDTGSYWGCDSYVIYGNPYLTLN